jgi:hypothetical protein
MMERTSLSESLAAWAADWAATSVNGALHVEIELARAAHSSLVSTNLTVILTPPPPSIPPWTYIHSPSIKYMYLLLGTLARLPTTHPIPLVFPARVARRFSNITGCCPQAASPAFFCYCTCCNPPLTFSSPSHKINWKSIDDQWFTYFASTCWESRTTLSVQDQIPPTCFGRSSIVARSPLQFQAAPLMNINIQLDIKINDAASPSVSTVITETLFADSQYCRLGDANPLPVSRVQHSYQSSLCQIVSQGSLRWPIRFCCHRRRYI